MENIEKKETEQQWHHVVTVEPLEGLKRKVGITYDAEAVKMAFDKASEEVRKRAMINGFRRGKAPRALIEKFCAKEIEAAAATLLSQEGYLHAVYEHKLSALSDPKVQDSKFHVDGTYSCSVLVEVKPEITPTGYIGLRLERPPIDKVKIAENMMSNLRQHCSEYKEREDVTLGSTVVVDYSVMTEGQEIVAHQGTPFSINDKGQLPLGNVSVLGLKIGDKVEAEMVLPADFKEHSGKEAKVCVEVRRILESTILSDDELAIRNGLRTAAELIEGVQQQASAEAEKQARQHLEMQVVDALLNQHLFSVPLEWIEKESQYLVRQLGITGEMDEATSNAVKDMSERNVKRAFMMDAIYDAEPTLQVKSEELESFLDHEAARQAIPKSTLKRMIQKQGIGNEILEFLKNKKLMDFIISNAEISDTGTNVPQTTQGE